MAHPRRFSDAAAADLRRRYEAGATLRELARETGQGVSVVHRTLLRVGTPMRPAHYRAAPGRKAEPKAAACVTRAEKALERGREIVRWRLAGEKWIVIAHCLGLGAHAGSDLMASARRALITDGADAETWARVFPRAAGRHRPIQQREAA